MKYKIMVVKKFVDGDKMHIIEPDEEYTLDEIQAFKKGVEEVQNETTKCYIIVEGDE
jgi:hypothetical protein